MSTSDEVTPSIQIKKRRRSSLITRKSIAPVFVVTQEVVERQYVTEANQEIKEWEDLAKQRNEDRKAGLAALNQASADPPTFTLETIQGDLTKEDLVFLKGAIDMSKFVSDVEIVIKKASILKTFVEGVDSLIKSNELLAESHIDAIAANLCHFNDVTPVWQLRKK